MSGSKGLNNIRANWTKAYYDRISYNKQNDKQLKEYDRKYSSNIWTNGMVKGFDCNEIIVHFVV